MLENWPSCTKSEMSKSVTHFVDNKGKKGVPLYQNFAENLHHLKNSSKKVSQIRLDLINEFEELRNKD